MKRTLTPEDEAVLADLRSDMTYDAIREKHGWSRGRIYALAMRERARKTEARIEERRAERVRRQRETLEEVLDRTATADVLDFMDHMPDGSAGLVVTSPPYNVGRSYGGSASSDRLRFVMYTGWLSMIISESSRILADGGVLALQVGSTRDHLGQMVPIDMLLLDAVQKSGLQMTNRVVWQVPHGLTPSTSRRLAGRHETVIIASKGVPATFNPTSARTPQKGLTKRAFKGPRKGMLSCHPLGAYPSDVWSIPNIGANNGERTGHPAQMPEELARRLVQLYTNPGDLVVDPFSGSGTTHSVCIETGRRFTGCDLHYEDLRARRLAKAGLADVCPLPGVTDESVAVWQAEATRVDYEPRQMDLLEQVA